MIVVSKMLAFYCKCKRGECERKSFDRLEAVCCHLLDIGSSFALYTRQAATLKNFTLKSYKNYFSKAFSNR